MTEDHHELWHHCLSLGQSVLPLMDQDPENRTERHRVFRTWEIDTGLGEQLLATFAALALHAVTADAAAAGKPLRIATLHAIPLHNVAAAAVGKRDYEFLAGLPEPFTDDAHETAVNTFRLLAYGADEGRRQLFRLSRELRHVLVALADRSATPHPTCGHLNQWMRQAGPA